MNQIELLNKCIEAEYLYNKLVSMSITLDYSDASFGLIKLTNEYYTNILNILNSNGIGGVMINGTFRYTSGDNQ